MWAVDPLGGRRGDALPPAPRVRERRGGRRRARRHLGAPRRGGVGHARPTRHAGDGPLSRSSGRRGQRGDGALRGLVGPRTFATAPAYTTRVAETASGASAVLAPRDGGRARRRAGAERSRTRSASARRGVARRADGGRRAGAGRLYAADTWSPVQPWQVQAGAARRGALGAPGGVGRGQPAPVRPLDSGRRPCRRACGPQPADAGRAARRGDGGPFPLAAALVGRRRRQTAARRRRGRPGSGAEWAPTDALALSVDALRAGRARPVLRGRARAPCAARGPRRRRGRRGPLRARRRGRSRSLPPPLSRASARPGRAWRPAPFARPLTGGLLVERALGPLASRVAPRRRYRAAPTAHAARPPTSGPASRSAPGRRAAASASRASRRRRSASLGTSWGGDAAGGPLPLARDGRALPAFPTLSVAARW